MLQTQSNNKEREQQLPDVISMYCMHLLSTHCISYKYVQLLYISETGKDVRGEGNVEHSDVIIANCIV